MIPNIPNEAELKLLITRPKLTMKLLNKLITELSEENQQLMRRLEALERELNEQRLLLGEIAVTAEQFVWNTPGNEAVIVEPEQPEPYPTEVPEYVQMTRSEKHFVPKKKWFWFL